ncbi:MAG: diaminopimelate epimerase [archaeon]|nr:diaminopimelate epimerase [archaeon]
MLPEVEELLIGDFLIKDLKFVKCNGLGNDFVLINNMDYNIPENYLSNLAKKLCNRNFWIGSDGLLLICESEDKEKFDIKYRMFNPDGSEAEMCGNGIRAFAQYVYTYGIVKKEVLKVDTLAGLIVPKLNIVDGKIKDVTVDMGIPIFERSKIPIAGLGEGGKCLNEKIEVGGKTFEFTGVSMGNPHAVIFVDSIDMDEVKKFGPMIETHEMFPARMNVEFVQILSETEENFSVWERGAGITLACGTGACASVAAGVILEKFKPNTDILVHLPGGDLSIKYADGKIWMTGPAVISFEGIIKEIYI